MKLHFALTCLLISLVVNAKTKNVEIQETINSVVSYHCNNAGFKNSSDFLNSYDYLKLSSCFEKVSTWIDELTIDPPGPTADNKTEQRFELNFFSAELNNHYYNVKYLYELKKAHLDAAQK